MFHWVPVEEFTVPILQMIENQTLVILVFDLIRTLLIEVASFMAQS